MEKRIRRIEVVVFVILILILVNFIAPFYGDIVNKLFSSEETTVAKELPASLSRDFLNKKMYKIKTDFNRSDWAELHNVFGELAQAQIDVEDIGDGFIKLKSATGNIETYAYSHYNYIGYNENADWFEVFYKCRFKNGKGTVKLSIRTADNSSEITGINIYLDEL